MYIGIEKVETPRQGDDLDRILLQREAEWIYRYMDVRWVSGWTYRYIDGHIDIWMDV